MRRFADFWVRVESVEESTAILDRLASLGFSAACIETSLSGAEWENLVEKAKEHQLKVVRKRIVDARRRLDVLEACRRKPPRTILTIRPLSREALMTACRDERVDTVIVDIRNVELDKHVIQVMRNFIEITLRDFVLYLGDRELFKRMITTLQVIRRKNLRCIISSGAKNPIHLRSPRQLASLPELVEIQPEQSLDMVSKNPFTILEGGRYLD